MTLEGQFRASLPPAWDTLSLKAAIIVVLVCAIAAGLADWRKRRDLSSAVADAITGAIAGVFLCAACAGLAFVVLA